MQPRSVRRSRLRWHGSRRKKTRGGPRKAALLRAQDTRLSAQVPNATKSKKHDDKGQGFLEIIYLI